MPEETKNTEYWLKRRKNNEAARRSREKRKMNDVLLERRVMLLTEENKQLRAQLLAIKMKYGELNDMCVPLPNGASVNREFYDKKFESPSPDAGLLLSPELTAFSHRDIYDTRAPSRHFTSKVFTNASGDTSATVLVNKLPGSSQVHGSKFSISEFSSVPESEERVPDDELFEMQPETNGANGRTEDKESPNSEKANNTDDEIRNYEEAAAKFSENFKHDILKSLNINHSVATNFPCVPKEAIEQNNYFLPSPFRKNQANPTNTFVQGLMSIEKNGAFQRHCQLTPSPMSATPGPETTHQVTDAFTKGKPKIILEVPGELENCDADATSKQENRTQKRKHSKIPIGSESEISSENVDKISLQEISSCKSNLPTHDAGAVQLPHKLRLKKCGKFPQT